VKLSRCGLEEKERSGCGVDGKCNFTNCCGVTAESSDAAGQQARSTLKHQHALGEDLQAVNQVGRRPGAQAHPQIQGPRFTLRVDALVHSWRLQPHKTPGPVLANPRVCDSRLPGGGQLERSAMVNGEADAVACKHPRDIDGMNNDRFVPQDGTATCYTFPQAKVSRTMRGTFHGLCR